MNIQASRARCASLPIETALSSLFYGHEGRYIQSHPRPYQPRLAKLEPITIGQLQCGCWTVLDGNSRIALLLEANPEATVADLPATVLSVYGRNTWDQETHEWWNPSRVA